MQEPREGGESLRPLRHEPVPVPALEVCTALGSFISPSRRVKDWE
jgi:hypothetical protein